MFYDRFIQLCSEKGVKPTPLVVSMGLSSSNVSQWKKGSTPRPAILKKLADYFGVSPEYLMFGDDAQKNPAALPDDGMDADFREKYEMLTDDQKKLIEQMIDGLLGARGVTRDG